MEDYTPYTISAVDRPLDTAANLPTALQVAKRHANALGHHVYIVSRLLPNTLQVEPDEA